MSSDDGWCTIESDPGVFTSMVETFGAQNIEVVELLTLHDEETLRSLEPIYGFLFLFKWNKKMTSVGVQTPHPDADAIYFAQQTIHNACATQALINVLMNTQEQIDVGDILKEFHSFTAEMDPSLRGDMIGQHDVLRTVHNSFSRPQSFDFERQKKKSRSDEDVYHFVAFIHKKGAIWELDGLRPGPVRLGDCPNPQEWVSVASQCILKRMDEIAALDTSGTGQGISFNLMVLTEDRLKKYERLSLSNEEQASHYEVLAQEVRAEREQQREENARRRHNYIPTLVALLKKLASDHRLEPLLDRYPQ